MIFAVQKSGVLAAQRLVEECEDILPENCVFANCGSWSFAGVSLERGKEAAVRIAGVCAPTHYNAVSIGVPHHGHVAEIEELTCLVTAVQQLLGRELAVLLLDSHYRFG